jgi:hypothetical protein
VGVLITRMTLINKNSKFLGFLDVSAIDRDTLFMVLKPTAERPREVCHRDTSDSPPTLLLKGLLGEDEADKLHLPPE